MTFNATEENAGADDPHGYAAAQRIQDIKDSLGDLEPEEAAQIALDTLRGMGRIVKSWCRDDISGILDQDPESTDLTPEQREAVLNYAEESGEYQNLEDATDSDWDAISQAIDGGLMSIRVDTRPSSR